jgi:hypothetical protein
MEVISQLNVPVALALVERDRVSTGKTCNSFSGSSLVTYRPEHRLACVRIP